tara:strand:- start:241 stop:411 length:171 start_codon:yes stop_codon:yes gene_type:complete
MIIGTLLKNAVKILATNPTARKKAGELAFKGYQKAKPIIKETSKLLKKTIKENLNK